MGSPRRFANEATQLETAKAKTCKNAELRKATLGLHTQVIKKILESSVEIKLEAEKDLVQTHDDVK